MSVDEIAPLLATAESYLTRLPALETGRVMAQIAEIRAELAPGLATPPVLPAEQGVVGEVPPADEALRLSQARSRVTQARAYVQTGRPEFVEPALTGAAAHLSEVGEASRVALLAEIEEVRAELAAVLTAERTTRAETELTGHLDTATTSLPGSPELAAVALKRFADRLVSAEVRDLLADEAVERYAARGVELTARLAASIKQRALARALPSLTELERRLADGPYAGLDQRGAYQAARELRELKHRVLAAVAPLPGDDLDMRDVQARLVAADTALARAALAWGTRTLQRRVGGTWAAISADIAGWEGESATPGLLEEPDLPLTLAAIRRTHPLARAGHQRAREVFGSAAAALYRAYARVLDEAEKIPTPLRGIELDKPGRLLIAAGYTFAGTDYLDPLAARIRELQTRWRADAVATARTRQDVYAAAVAEAESVWPRIVAATGALDDFDPVDETSHGRTVLIPAAHNRAGADFRDADFRDIDFAMRRGGVPVGGSFEPHVLRALEHAWYDLRLDVDHHRPWDLLAVVEGPTLLAERTVVTLTDRDTGAEIGTVEEWRAAEGVRLRIVGLHAGPVATGPGF